MTYKPLVFLAVLSTTAILACKDDPSGLGGTGSLVLIVVPYEEAQPAAGADAHSDATADAGKPNPSVTPAAAEGRSLGEAVTEAPNTGSAVEAAQQQSRRDFVRITLVGPTSLTQNVTPNTDGSVDVTIPNLLVGSYEIQLLGIDTDLGGEVVSEFGRTTGVQVLEDQTRQATITFGSFVPDIDPNIATTTHEFAFDVNYRSVPTATEYLVEEDTDPAFSAPTTFQLTGTTHVLSVNTTGFIYVRVRAQNNFITFNEARPSDPVAIEVVTDISPSGDDAASAPSLGVGRSATGRYTDFNIYPATDEDWFALDLTTDATLSVEVLSGSLTQPALEMASPEGTASPSDLDPYLEIFDPGLNLIASNDNDVTLEPRLIDVPISTDGTHYIRVTSSTQSSVGHYELIVTVNAPAVWTVTVTPSTAQIIPTGQVQLTGRTFDQFDVELFSREAIWSSSDDVITTVDGTGLVTGQSLGTATITLESEGISGSATIDVTNVPAVKVVITPRSGLLQGIGQTVQWSAEAFDSSDNTIVGKPINWRGANPAVADADAGLVEAFGNGQTIIVAEADGAEGYALVTVTDPSAQAANYWSDGPASGVTEILFDIWGTSSNAMYAVGDAGTILFNDGTGWTPQTSGVPTESLERVWGLDENTVWAVGTNGTIVSTGDMGANWTLTTPTTELLTGIWGAAPNDIFVVGGFGGTGIVLHYDGASWSNMTIPVATPLLSVWGSASDDVFAVGSGGIILHYDGTSWTQMTSPTTEFLRTVWGTSNNDVFAVGTNGTIVHYLGGGFWEDLTNPSVTTAFLRSVWGTSSTEVIAAGEGGTIIQYDGASWTAGVSATTETLYGVWGSPNPGILAVGTNGTVRLGSRGATVVVSPNPGQIDALGSTLQMNAEVQDQAGNVVASGNIFGWNTSDALIAAIDVNGLVTAIANGTVTITADIAGLSGTADVTVQQLAATITVTPDAVTHTLVGGVTNFTASAQDANGNAIAGATFNWSSLNPNVAGMNATTGVATAVASGQATVAAERDGTMGYALVNVAIPVATAVDLVSADASGTTEPIFGIWGPSASDIFAVRSMGTVLHYDGTNWTTTPTSTTAWFRDVWGSSSSDVFAVGAGGAVFHYDGSTWASISSGTSEDLWGVWGSSPENVFAVGSNGTVLQYDGSSWNALTSGTINELRGVWGTSGSDVFVVGKAGTVLHYDGANWTTMTSNTTNDLFAVWGASGSDVFAVGGLGTIIRYTGTWAVMTSPTSSTLRGLWGSAASDVYSAGDLGTLAYYDGVNWTTLPTGTTANLEAIWGTPNPAILMVGANGTIARGSRGATMSGLQASISFDALGSTEQITPTLTDEDGTTVTGVQFDFASDNAADADVDANGVVSAVSNGSANITVTVPTAPSISGVVPVTVSQVAVAFAIVPNSASLAIGETLRLIGGSLDANNNLLETQPPITWLSDNTAIATVDGTGLVTGVSIGTATITADDGIATPATAAITVTIPNTAASISAGQDHSCAIADGGVAYCWGQNNNGQLGDGTTSPSTSPVQVAGGLTFASITAGHHHSCGLAPDGTAYCWGNNGNGQLGDNTFTTSFTPVAVAGGLQFAELSSGGYHTCGITTTGVPYCWGWNSNGQVGDGTLNQQNQPVGVAGGHTFQSMATGRAHSCGVDLTGNVYCWGFNNSGQLGDVTTTQRTSPVMASTPGGLVFRAVSAGEDHTCALVDASDGTDPSAVYCWGRGNDGQLGNATNTQSSTPVRTFGAFLFESIDAGRNHTCATSTAGAGLCWGAGYDGAIGNGSFNSIDIPTAVSGGLTFAKIMAGGTHSCGRTTGGDAYCWGRNNHGALGTGGQLTFQPAFALGSAASVAAGERHTCVLSSGGSASCVGQGTSGQLGQGVYQNELSPVAVSGSFTFVSVEAGAFHTCGLETSPGDIYCWGNGGSGQLGNGVFGSTNAPATMVTGSHSFVEVTVGRNYGCGLTNSGDVYCWGRNGYGQLGNNSTTNSQNPVLVLGGNTYTTVTGGWYHTCALADTGLAYCWGRNDNGQLGDGTNTESWVPVAVAGGAAFTQIEAGGYHVCTLDATDAAFCWGRGYSGQLGNNQFTHSDVPQAVAGGFTFTDLTAGSYYTCAIRSTGATMCWGRNYDGELGDGTFDRRGIPTTVSGGLSFTNLGGGFTHMCGVIADGSLYCWGSNDEGQLGLGFTSRVATPAMVTGGLTFVIPPPEER